MTHRKGGDPDGGPAAHYGLNEQQGASAFSALLPALAASIAMKNARCRRHKHTMRWPIYYIAIVFTMMQPIAISGRTNPICRHGFTAETVIEPPENPGEYRTFEAAVVAGTCAKPRSNKSSSIDSLPYSGACAGHHRRREAVEITIPVDSLYQHLPLTAEKKFYRLADRRPSGLQPAHCQPYRRRNLDRRSTVRPRD
jgi:hypothetical protein